MTQKSYLRPLKALGWLFILFGCFMHMTLLVWMFRNVVPEERMKWPVWDWPDTVIAFSLAYIAVGAIVLIANSFEKEVEVELLAVERKDESSVV